MELVPRPSEATPAASDGGFGFARPGALAPQDVDLALAVASHEFRSPLLDADLAFAEILAGSGLSQRERLLLAEAKEQIRGVAEAMDGILVWAAGRRRVARRLVDLHRLLVEVVDECLRGSDGARVDVSGDRMLVPVDRLLLRSAMANVVRNALTHGGPDASVRVALHRYRRTVAVSVRDRGPGPTVVATGSPVSPLVRGNLGSRARRVGLGLYIASRIVQEHGGELRIAPGSPGTVVRISLPLGGVS